VVGLAAQRYPQRLGNAAKPVTELLSKASVRRASPTNHSQKRETKRGFKIPPNLTKEGLANRSHFALARAAQM
jgi:hypothetical protein